jgi:hypothetical protein
LVLASQSTFIKRWIHDIFLHVQST